MQYCCLEWIPGRCQTWWRQRWRVPMWGYYDISNRSGKYLWGGATEGGDAVGGHVHRPLEGEALQPLLEVYTRQTGFEEGGRKRRPWWRQRTKAEVFRTTLEEAPPEGQRRYQDWGGAEEDRDWKCMGDAKRDLGNIQVDKWTQGGGGGGRGIGVVTVQDLDRRQRTRAGGGDK